MKSFFALLFVSAFFLFSAGSANAFFFSKDKPAEDDIVAEFPSLKVGDTFTFKFTPHPSLSREKADTISERRIVAVNPDKSFVYEKRVNGKLSGTYWKNDKYQTTQVNHSSGKTEKLDLSNDRHYLDFPLFVGKKWVTEFESTSVRGIKEDYKQWSKVVEYETIVTPAGTFDAFRIESRHRCMSCDGTSSWRIIHWYAPKLGIIVREKTDYRAGWELISYTLGEEQPTVAELQGPQPESKPSASESIKSFSSAVLKDETPPLIEIDELLPSRSIKVISGEYVAVSGRITDASGVSWVRINGRPTSFDGEGRFRDHVSLQPGLNTIRVSASDLVGNIGTRTVEISAAAPAEATTAVAAAVPQMTAPVMKPTLWALAIGVSRYNNADINLRYAANDARVLLQEIKKNSGDLYGEVFTKMLLDEEATRQGIIMAMQSFLGQASKGDVVFIFVAGHGVQHRATGSYYFLTHDADDSNMIAQALKWSDFQEMVKILARNVDKIILAVDTCHSGAMKVSMRSMNPGEDLAAMIREGSGLYTLAASKAGEESMESDKFAIVSESPGHGAFTYALVDGLRGKADYDGNRYISIGELFSYVSKIVPRLTQGGQHPYAKISGTDIPFTTLR